MSYLPLYENLYEKRRFFSNGEEDSFIIDTKDKLEKRFYEFHESNLKEKSKDVTAIIYRDVIEAKYKLLTSAQRLWISDEMHQWSTKYF